jgi:hypothetical protein
MGGIYTPSHRKLAVGKRVSGYSGFMSGYSKHWGPEPPDSENFTDGEQLSGDSEYISGYFDISVRIFRIGIRTLRV